MILTYAEIADTAARKGERIVSPLVLAAGTAPSGSALRWPRRSRNWPSRTLRCSTPACLGERAVLRRDLHGRRRLSVLRAQACLSDAMPAAVPVFLRELADHGARRFQARAAARPLLPRLLLGDDAGDVRGRGDERGVDGGARRAHDDRKDAVGSALQPSRRRGADWLSAFDFRARPLPAIGRWRPSELEQ